MATVEKMAENYRIGRYKSLGMTPQYHHADIEAAFTAGYERWGYDVETLSKRCADLAQHNEQVTSANFEEQRKRENAQKAAEALRKSRDEWKQVAEDRAGWTPPDRLEDLQKAAYDAGFVSGAASKRDAERDEAIRQAANDVAMFGTGTLFVNHEGVKHVPIQTIGVDLGDDDRSAYVIFDGRLVKASGYFDPGGASPAQQAKPHADTLNTYNEGSNHGPGVALSPDAMAALTATMGEKVECLSEPIEMTFRADEPGDYRITATGRHDAFVQKIVKLKLREAPGPSDQVRDLQAKLNEMEARADKWEARALTLNDALNDIIDTLD